MGNIYDDYDKYRNSLSYSKQYLKSSMKNDNDYQFTVNFIVEEAGILSSVLNGCPPSYQAGVDPYDEPSNLQLKRKKQILLLL